MSNNNNDKVIEQENIDNNRMWIESNDFKGPLDLLYSLIKERKYNIMDLNLLDVCNEYIRYIHTKINDVKVDEFIEYLLMISYFIEYKSKKLIPIHNDESKLEKEIQDDIFLQRILLSKQFKELVPKLSTKFKERSLYANKVNEDNLNEVFVEEKEVVPDFISPNKLLKAMQKVFRRINETNNYIRNIEIKELSIDTISYEIINLLKEYEDHVLLSELLDNIPAEKMTPQYLAVSFVSLLVLVRNGIIRLRQNILSDDLDINIEIINLELDFEME